MNPEWYYTANGGQQGPVTAADLKKLAQAGTISKEDLVWKEGMPNWVPAKNVKGLFTPLGASGETKAISQSGEAKKAAPAPAPAAPADVAPAPEERPSQARPKAVREEPPVEEPDVAEEEERPRRSRRDAEDDDDDRPRRSRRDDDEEDDRPRSSRRRDEDDDDEDRPRHSRLRDDEDDEDEDRPRRPKRRKKKSVRDGKGLAIAAMICGLLGLAAFLSSCCGFQIAGPQGEFAGLVSLAALLAFGLNLTAVILGYSSLQTAGRGFALTGLITGLVGLIPFLLGVILMMFGMALVGGGRLR